jgi:serine/threonine-protein kinase
VRKAGKHARSCFALDALARPLRHIQNSFQKRDHYTVNDTSTGLIWQIGGSHNVVNLQGAQQYIDGLNARKFAGINTWRLPTVNELVSLFNYNGSMAQYCRPAIFGAVQVRLWSCDRRSDRTAWYVNSELEFVGWQDENCFNYVRGVSTMGA